MARHARPSLLLAAFLLLVAIPTVSIAQHEEYEERAFESWLAGASCDELEDEARFLRTSLATRKEGMRNWKMGLRVQLSQAHRRYATRCIQGMRYWSYECLSIQRTMDILRRALDDDELVSDVTAERGILQKRRQRIEQRGERACEPEAPTAAENTTPPVEPDVARAVPEDARLEVPSDRIKADRLQLDGAEVSGNRWVLKPGRHSLDVRLRASEPGAYRKIRIETVCELSFDAEEGGDYVVSRRIVDADAARERTLIAWISRRDEPDHALGRRYCVPADAAAFSGATPNSRRTSTSGRSQRRSQ